MHYIVCVVYVEDGKKITIFKVNENLLEMKRLWITLPSFFKYGKSSSNIRSSSLANSYDPLPSSPQEGSRS